MIINRTAQFINKKTNSNYIYYLIFSQKQKKFRVLIQIYTQIFCFDFISNLNYNQLFHYY